MPFLEQFDGTVVIQKAIFVLSVRMSASFKWFGDKKKVSKWQQGNRIKVFILLFLPSSGGSTMVKVGSEKTDKGTSTPRKNNQQEKREGTNTQHQEQRKAPHSQIPLILVSF